MINSFTYSVSTDNISAEAARCQATPFSVTAFQLEGSWQKRQDI